MTPTRSPEGDDMAREALANLPLQYVDGPEYCTVTDATGGAFALTVQPELMRLMEAAALRPPADRVKEAVAWRWKYHDGDSWQHCSTKYTPPRRAISEPLYTSPVDARRESLEQTVDLLESNARVQAKLLADTGRHDEKATALLQLGTWYMTPAAQLDWKNKVEEFLSSVVPSADSRGGK